jgi:adenosylcobinamide kinase / adenosylcobinamide-phosphate guanylyltransferase
MIDLVLGGNKSGKSDFGLDLLRRGPRPWTLVATGKSRDLAFREQILAHRRSRDADIAVQETDTDLAGALRLLRPCAGKRAGGQPRFLDVFAGRRKPRIQNADATRTYRRA